jgi:dsDNA-specific endonuclease/ATPase MutS2
MSELYNDRDYFDRMFASIDDNFHEIKGRLDRLNGNVARHEKIINENLPHDVSMCTQSDAIKKLQDNMVTERAVKKTLYIGFGIICTLIGAIFAVVEILR